VAVQDISVLTLSERPLGPIQKSSPLRFLLAIVGGLLWFALVYLRIWLSEAHAGTLKYNGDRSTRPDDTAY